MGFLPQLDEGDASLVVDDRQVVTEALGARPRHGGDRAPLEVAADAGLVRVGHELVQARISSSVVVMVASRTSELSIKALA